MEMGRRTITRFSGGVNRGLRIEKCEYGVHLSLKEYVATFFSYAEEHGIALENEVPGCVMVGGAGD